MLKASWDPKQGHFWLEVGVAAGDPLGRASDSGGRWAVGKFIVDSGSNRSGVSEILVQEIGIDVGKLEYSEVYGISGAVTHRMAENIDLWFLATEPRPVRLATVIVIPKLRRRVQKRPGKYAFKGGELPYSVNILGLDAIEALEGRLQIDMSAKSASISW
jgi:hypothetical protein